MFRGDPQIAPISADQKGNFATESLRLRGRGRMESGFSKKTGQGEFDEMANTARETRAVHH